MHVLQGSQIFKSPITQLLFAWKVQREVDEKLKCHYCQKDVALPFKCAFCGKYFCPDHRLPENHACTELWKAKIRPAPLIERGNTVDFGGKDETSNQRAAEYPIRIERERWTSITEIYHLAIGAAAVMAVGLSMSGIGLSWIYRTVQNPAVMLGSALLFMFIFISHELAHKASAKHFGMWAEFRLSLFGIALTVISIASPLIKIISPGAIMVSGAVNRKIMGKIAFAGPLVNIFFAVFLYFMILPFRTSQLNIIFSRGAALSSWMAMFNLIPIGMLDGAKVMWWSKAAWAAGFGISLMLSLIVVYL